MKLEPHLARVFVLAALGGLAFGACQCGKAPPPPSLLGAQPRLDFLSDGGVPDLDAGFSRFVLWISTEAAASEVSVRCDGVECTVQASRERKGSTRGVVALVIDDSGSNVVGPETCTGCPTDPDGGRGLAAQAFFLKLLGEAPGWRAALFDFGLGPNANFDAVRLIAGYSGSPDDLVAGTQQFEGGSGTYVYDSIWEVAPTVAGERLGLDGGVDVPAHLLLVTDGEDTSSRNALFKAVSRAAELGVVVDSVGYGRSDGGPIPLLAGKAYRDLRLIASATGGFSNIVQTDVLVPTLERIVDAYLHGVVEVELGVPPGTERVSGTVSVSGAQLPFSF